VTHRSFTEGQEFLRQMGETIAWPGEREGQASRRWLADPRNHQTYLDYLQGGAAPYSFAEPEGEEAFSSREQALEALTILSNDRRQPGESAAAAMDRYISTDSLGAELAGIYSNWPADPQTQAQSFAESRPARRSAEGEEAAFFAETDALAKQFVEDDLPLESARALVWERYPKLMARGLRLGI
jgi:hypothetical protein